MAETLSFNVRRGPEAVFPLHFQVPANSLPLTTFIQTAQSAELLIAAVNDLVFGGQMEFKVVVLPSATGSFKGKLGIFVIGVAGLWSFLDSDIGASFVKNLTDHEPAYWSGQLGLEIRNALTPATVTSTTSHTKELARVRLSGRESEVLSELTKSILAKPTSELRATGFTPQNFRLGFEARNEFYGACLLDTSVSAIGFTENEEFPIPRSAFDSMRMPLPPEEEDHVWSVELTDVRVTSPNWDRTDSHRNWKGRDAHGRERHFRIEDENFWRLAQDRMLNVNVIDTMTAQWVFRIENNRAKSFRVLKVINFNGIKLSDILSDEELSKIIGQHHYESSFSYQPDLFS